MEPVMEGRVWKFGDNVSGDDGIIDFSVMKDLSKPFDDGELGRMAFRHVRPEFQEEVQPGDLIVGGRNFAKDNHPQVGVAIRASGIQAVICESTDTGFVRKSLNVGLPVLICPGVADLVDEGQQLRVDFKIGEVCNLETGRSLSTRPYSERMLAILGAGTLVKFLQGHVAQRDNVSA